MFNVFAHSFYATLLAFVQILLIAIVAGVLTRKKIITAVQTQSLSAVMIRVFLPCLTFSSIVHKFNPSELKIWPILPLASILMVIIGIAASAFLFRGQLPQKKNMLAIASLQNAGYLILPLGKMLYPEQFDEFAMYCFLVMLAVSPILWSLGKWLICPNNGEKLSIAQLITPPFAANVLGVLAVFTGLRNIIPSEVLTPVSMLGEAAVPCATFILGSVLGSINLNIKPYIKDAVKALSVKLLVLPALTVLALKLTGLYVNYPMMCNLLVLQATAAPATAMLIQIKHYGGDEQKIGSIYLLSYLACIFTIPLWLGIWAVLNG